MSYNLREMRKPEAHVETIYGVPELHEHPCGKTDKFVEFQTSDTAYVQKSAKMTAGSLKFTIPSGN